MKLLQELIMLAAVAFLAWLGYKLYLAGKTTASKTGQAADAVTNLASQYTPGALATSLGNGLINAGDDVFGDPGPTQNDFALTQAGSDPNLQSLFLNAQNPYNESEQSVYFGAGGVVGSNN